MIVWGGNAGGGVYSNTGGRYDPVEDLWTPTTSEGDLPAARSLHGAAWANDGMLVHGGSSTMGTHADLHTYYPGPRSLYLYLKR